MIVFYILVFFIQLAQAFSDSGTTSFSSEGRIFQVEYALKAISFTKPIVGMVTSEGVLVIGVRSIGSRLEDREAPSFGEKVHEIDSHIVVAVTGMAADAPALVTRCRDLCAAHRKQFGCPMPVGRLAGRLADTFQAFTQRGGLRPFGVAFLVAGHDTERGLQLYATDPSGNFDSWQAMAWGAGSEKLVNGLEELFDEHGDLGKDGVEMSLSLKTALRRAKGLLESVQKDKSKNRDENEEILIIEVGLVLLDPRTNKATTRILSFEEIQQFMQEQ